MRTVLRSSRRARLYRLGIFFVALALALGAPACDDTYRLTIFSTEGGAVTTPGEGSSTHEAGTVLELVATPDDGYRFVEWTGDIDTIADATSASTNITMNANYSITASFSEHGDGGNGGSPDPIRP